MQGQVKLTSFYFIIKRLFVVKVAPLLKPLSLKANDFLWLADDHPDSSFIFYNNFIFFLIVFFLVDGRINYLTSYENPAIKSQS